ncbi:MAG: adenosylcobinamide-phosphate synthase CbiB [Calditerrivibrio sp.]|nr:adenosylcobinamide-phosphate synthase CbiB [Calditerrivibrio sp.]MCA1932725.1 adenosylcobinamide-phosphate synthase CbiB [Calditerrivibrio sp.]
MFDYSQPLAFLVAFIIDRLVGDPEFRYHPVRFIGLTASCMEIFLNNGRFRILKGMIFTLVLITIWYLLFYFIENYIEKYKWLYFFYQIVFIYFGISSYELSKRVLRIEKLIKEDIDESKKELSLVVGRDTKPLDVQGIRRSMIETISENFSDGFMAPLLYYLLGGIPLLYVYKVVNTLDSMVGYKNEKFKDFGFFSAKVDDIFNFIPSRLSALIISLASMNRDSLAYALRYGRNHTSPNSGYPEAAMAGAIGCRLGGPNYYGGILFDKPYIGDNDRDIEELDIYRSVEIIRRSSYISVIIALGVLLL